MIIASRTQKADVFDELAPELRELIDYGPLNPDSAFAALDMQRVLGAKEAVRRIRAAIAAVPETWAADTGHTWKPEKTNPLRGSHGAPV